MISRAVFLVEMKMILLVELLHTILLVALYFACYRCNPENSHQRAHLTGFLRRSMAECIWRERERARERERESVVKGDAGVAANAPVNFQTSLK